MDKLETMPRTLYGRSADAERVGLLGVWNAYIVVACKKMKAMYYTYVKTFIRNYVLNENLYI